MTKYFALWPLPFVLRKVPSWIWVTVLYFITHLPRLTLLPVFADEAIYIRWAQLIIDEPARYAFFSMSDGKPPLFIWLLSLTLRPFADPLFAARFTSLLIGLVTVFAVGKLAKILTGNPRVTLIAQVLTCLIPFWWFYHRMGLMDSLLTLLLTLSFYFAVKIAKTCQRETGIAYDTIPDVLLLGLMFGGALLTKTPALFAVPLVMLTPFLSLVRSAKKNQRTTRQRLYESIILIGLGGMFGFFIFALLKVSPFFGALFARSSDFTFSLGDILSGEWRYVLTTSMPREVRWITQYMTIGVMLMALAGVLFRKTRKTVLFLLVLATMFAAPLILFGRVLYPRYFLPVAPFLTIAGSIGLIELWRHRKFQMIAGLFLFLSVLQSLAFIIPSFTSISSIPFVSIDRMQYLEEWSAGFGNKEVVEYVRKSHSTSLMLPIAQRSFKTIVLTEGSFGTLPDGILMYFFGPNQLPNVEIHGIGVAPNQIPAEYLSLTWTADVYYAVNSHRLGILDKDLLELVFEVKRPGDAPSLLFYRVRGK